MRRVGDSLLTAKVNTVISIQVPTPGTHTRMALLGCWITDYTAAVALLFILIYYWWTSVFSYWKDRKVPYVKPSFPFGNFAPFIFGKVSFVQMMDTYYHELKSNGYGGIFNMRSPALIVCTPEMAKQFLTKDFNAFHGRGMPHDEEHDPISAHLFSLEGERWKTIRAKMSPTFTSGKIKGMFPLIYVCTENFKACLQDEIKKSTSVEMKDLLFRFAADVIGTCAFGIDCNSLNDKQSEFHKFGRDVIANNLSNNLRFSALFLFPKLAKYLTFRRFFPQTVDFFTTLMDSTVKYRRENNVERSDFVQLMMKLVDEDATTFSQDIMTSQAFLFFLAGLDNAANNVGFCLHAMAVDQELQERVYQEIRRVLEEYDGKNCYEAIGKMDLLCRVVDESLRMYSPVGVLIRMQTADTYVIPGTDVEIQKGTQILIPTGSFHSDEEYFPDPLKFDPDRFTEEEKAKRHPYAYLPFGEGPRFCIASRFAQLEERVCLAELIRHFHFSVAPETDLSLEMDKTSFGKTPKRGFWLRVSERSAS